MSYRPDPAPETDTGTDTGADTDKFAGRINPPARTPKL